MLQEFADGAKPVCALVLGSGYGAFADSLEGARALEYEDVPNIAIPTSPSHRGRFVIGRTPQGYEVICMQGRLHGYEGLATQQVAFPIWLMNRALGVKVLVDTNAAGAINPGFAVGDYCIVRDHINLTGRNPLAGGQAASLALPYVPMNDAYDPALRDLAKQVARREGIGIHEGVYLGLSGPSFETPAEIHAFSIMGADTVAMSMVEEVIAARHVGMRVLGISLVSNMAAGIEGAVPSGQEVLDVAQTREEAFFRFACGIIDGIAAGA